MTPLVDLPQTLKSKPITAFQKNHEQRVTRKLATSGKISNKALFDYQRGLLGLVGFLKKELLKSVNQSLFYADGTISDDDKKVNLTKLSEKIDELRNKNIDESVQKLAQRFSTTQANSATDHYVNLVNQSLGIDLSGFLNKNDFIGQQIGKYTRDNVNLIQSIRSQLLDDVQAQVTKSAMSGGLAKDLSKVIQERTKVAESRAKLIARDQTLKINASINKANQQATGVTHFKWSTAKDGAVRSEHAELEGEVFSWNNPPPAGLPGEAVNCRCIAIPIFRDAIEQAQAAHDERQAFLSPVEGVIDKTDINYIYWHVKGMYSSGSPHNLTANDILHIATYTGKAHHKLNNALREGTATAKQIKFAERLDEALSKLPDHNGKTYRDIDIPKQNLKAFLKRYRQGEIVEEYQFTSTSQRNDLKGFSGNIKFIVYGKKGKDIEKMSLYPEEKEVLFKTKSRFYVKTVTEKIGSLKKTYIIKLEEIE